MVSYVSRFIAVLLFASLLPPTLSMPDSFDQFFPSKPPGTLELESNRTIVLDKYLNYTELENLLQHLRMEHKDILSMIHIGTSAVDHTPIWAVEITENVQKERELLKPMFKFVANVHGDETVGYALMVSLIQYLVFMYKNKDKRVKKILENIDVWIIPTLNPDGLSRAKEGQCETLEGGLGRGNGHSKDVGTNFKLEFSSDERAIWSETYSMVKFLLDEEHPFVLSANLQGGDIVASTPPVLGTIINSYWPLRTIPDDVTPDMHFFEYMARDYARKNRMMLQEKPCGVKHTNWYCTNYWKDIETHRNKKVMQDFNYIDTNCFELNLELSCCKYPHSKDLPYYWHANLDAMLSFIESTRQGVYGLVLDKDRKPVTNAVIVVLGNQKEIKVTKNGEYWRLLSYDCTNYTISAKAHGYKTKTLKQLVTYNESYVRLDFMMERKWYGSKRIQTL